MTMGLERSLEELSGDAFAGAVAWIWGVMVGEMNCKGESGYGQSKEI